eukprot:Skav209327  [mRNA]  locus=scaffold724:414152:417800:- [translate_table: standard]
MRRCVANRWMEVIKSRDYLPAHLYGETVQSTLAVLANAIEIHGMEIPFCFDPPDGALFPPSQSSAKAKPDATGSLSSSSSQKSCVVPHEIKFLVNGSSVMTIVFRSGEFQFSGATQLLPQGISDEQSALALEAFAKAVDGKMPSAASRPALPKDTFAWKEFRTATKMVLSAVANALQQAVHGDFSLASCSPANPLVPRSNHCDRLPLLPEEKKLHGLDPALTYHFNYNFQSGSKWPDYYQSEDHFKLVFSADEGTEATGFLCYLHMAHSQLWAVFWPDILHLTARRCAMTLQSSGAAEFIKKMGKVYKLSRGPFHSSKFGKQMQHSKRQLVEALRKETMQEDLIQAVLPGCARDCGVEAAEFSVSA